MKRFLTLLSLVGVCLLVLLLVPSQAHAQAYTNTSLVQQSSSSYSVLGSPTVSAEFINRVLAANHSPAAGKGQALFDYGVQYGVDPVYALAFFMHESSFGTTGIAQYTRSLGNLRCIPIYSCYNGFSSFPTWEAGFEAWYQLIRNVYVGTWHLVTVEQIVPTYAPSSDHNNVGAYINAVERAVDSWRAGQVSTFGAVPAVSGTFVTPVIPAPSTPVTGTSRTPYAADQYSIVGKPSVDVAFINQILTHYHSPAVGKGQLFYDEGVKYGIDPVYALAFFMRDSIFGTVGRARVTRSLGPLPTPEMATKATCSCQDFHSYRSYATWDAGIADWFRYMHDHYIKQLGLTTVSQIVSLYVTMNSSLAIQVAIKEIEHRVDVWHKITTTNSSSI